MKSQYVSSNIESGVLKRFHSNPHISEIISFLGKQCHNYISMSKLNEEKEAAELFMLISKVNIPDCY